MRASHRRRLGVLLALSLAVLPAGHAVLAASDPVLVLRAFAVSMTRGRANTLDIAIERWSTDEEREKLRGVLVEKGGGEGGGRRPPGRPPARQPTLRLLPPPPLAGRGHPVLPRDRAPRRQPAYRA